MGEFIKTETRLVVAERCGEEWEVTINRHEASLGGKENTLKLDSGDGSAVATGSLRRI